MEIFMHKKRQDHQAQNSSEQDECIKTRLSYEIWELWDSKHSSVLLDAYVQPDVIWLTGNDVLFTVHLWVYSFTLRH